MACTLYIKQYIVCVWFLWERERERERELKHSFEVDWRKKSSSLHDTEGKKIKVFFLLPKTQRRLIGGFL